MQSCYGPTPPAGPLEAALAEILDQKGRNEEGKLKEDAADLQELYAIYLTRFLGDRQGRNRAGLKNEHEKYDEQ